MYLPVICENLSLVERSTRKHRLPGWGADSNHAEVRFSSSALSCFGIDAQRTFDGIEQEDGNNDCEYPFVLLTHPDIWSIWQGKLTCLSVYRTRLVLLV